MPELPEVEVTCRGISKSILDQKITRLEVHQPVLRYRIAEQWAAIIKGQTIRMVTRRGKYILLHIDNGVIILHLGMSGHLAIFNTIILIHNN